MIDFDKVKEEEGEEAMEEGGEWTVILATFGTKSEHLHQSWKSELDTYVDCD